MSESANANGNAFAGDLLSSLSANPELLKNAMQMASALASSGMLNGLLGGSPGGEAPPSTSPQPPFQSAPSAGSGQPAGGIADLLAGLMGQSGQGASRSAEKAESGSPASQKSERESEHHGQEPRRLPTPSHNDRIHLLQSICPFLSEEKREKVQFLIKLLGLLSAAEQMGIGSGKLF